MIITKNDFHKFIYITIFLYIQLIFPIFYCIFYETDFFISFYLFFYCGIIYQYSFLSYTMYKILNGNEYIEVSNSYLDDYWGNSYFLLLYCILFISPMSIYTLLLLNIIIYQNEINNNYYKFFYSYTVIVFSSINIFFAFVLIKDRKKSIQMINIEYNEECIICYQNDGNFVLLQCGHIFHKMCIKEWIKRKRICPLCREEL